MRPATSVVQILSQVLGVSQCRDPTGRDLLKYTPESMPWHDEGSAPDATEKEVLLEKLNQCIAVFRDRIEQLAMRRKVATRARPS